MRYSLRLALPEFCEENKCCSTPCQTQSSTLPLTVRHPRLSDRFPVPIEYAVKCDRNLHCVLQVEVGPKFTTFIARDGKSVDLRKLPTEEYNKLYRLEYQDYSLAEYARKSFNSQRYGVIVTSRAKAHLNHLLQEPSMAKTSKPVAAEPVVPAPKGKSAPVAAPAEPKAEKKAKIVDPTATEGGESTGRARREKLPNDGVIKKLAENPARVGTIRHAIVDTIFQAKTVDVALASTVERKDGTEYKIGLPDLYFALDNGLIEIK